MPPNEDINIPITINFSGGLELMFSNKASHAIMLPSKIPGSDEPTNVKYLLKYLCDELMTDTRKDLFVLDDAIRPGVLVLINDADWELEGEEEYALQPGDRILFVSTLHGG
ncbi:ubiquitin-related modifier 1 [Kalaharituber pfeilii]|nr:ubiquitin-related modifier 1 [Kalaharituber pfeilii]